MNDPYQSPVANVDKVQHAGDFSNMPRLHTLIVVVLAVATFGLYLPYWAITRSGRFNTIYPDGQINLVFTYVVCAVYVLTYVFDLVEVSGINLDMDADLWESFDFINMLVYWSGSIGFLVWVFYFRYKLSLYLAREIKNPFNTPNIILTFFFGVIYLNFKINQTLDDLHQAEQVKEAGDIL